MKITEEIRRMIEENPLALATCSKDSKPHVIAVADVKLISKHDLLIGDNYMKTTKENLLENNQVSLAVWNNKEGSKAEGYSLEGTASYYDSGKWLEKAKEIHGSIAKGAIIVEINSIRKLAG